MSSLPDYGTITIMGRWLLFIITILLGIGLGLLYGWEINPIEYANTTYETLKIDYRADYVLMVAEIFSHEADLGKAMERLGNLSETAPEELIRGAIEFAKQAGYADQDLVKLNILLTAVEGKP